MLSIKKILKDLKRENFLISHLRLHLHLTLWPFAAFVVLLAVLHRAQLSLLPAAACYVLQPVKFFFSFASDLRSPLTIPFKQNSTAYNANLLK